jgi:hypothetical protein
MMMSAYDEEAHHDSKDTSLFDELRQQKKLRQQKLKLTIRRNLFTAMCSCASFNPGPHTALITLLSQSHLSAVRFNAS